MTTSVRWRVRVAVTCPNGHAFEIEEKHYDIRVPDEDAHLWDGGDICAVPVTISLPIICPQCHAARQRPKLRRVK